uniref:Uncharacterized protein n=1 Tax=candidate division WWE3 bacterium TaxID=2053526 RepID=A0A7C4XGC2_UNCKA
MTNSEIEELITKLELHNCLGEIAKYSSTEDRINHVKQFCGKLLLVTLLESTHGKQFHRILEDEFDKIVPPANYIYLHVCLVHSFGISLPTDVINRILKLKQYQFEPKLDIYMLTEGVMIQERKWGDTATIRARHRLISEVLVNQKLAKSEIRVEYIENLLSCTNENSNAERSIILKFFRSLLLQIADPINPKRKLEDAQILQYFMIGKRSGYIKFFPLIRAVKRMAFKSGRCNELNDWGYLYWKLRYLKGAISLYDDALVISPSHCSTHFYLALALYSQAKSDKNLSKRADEIEFHFRKAEPYYSNKNKYLNLYGQFTMAIGKVAYAALLLKKSLTLNPRDEQSLILFSGLIRSYATKNQYRELSEILGSVSQEYPRNLSTRINYIRALRGAALFKQAFDECQNLLVLFPDSLDAKSWMASLHIDFDRNYDKALNLIDEVISKYPNRDWKAAMFRNNKALWLKEKKGEENFLKAEACWKEAMEIDPTYYWAYINIGNFYHEVNEDSDLARYYISQGLKLARLKNNSEAIERGEAIMKQCAPGP